LLGGYRGILQCDGYQAYKKLAGTSADRLAVRQAESKPMVTELRIWFEAQIAKLPARSPTADAIRYALNHWDGPWGRTHRTR
jgi:transposase